jgi:putative zinc finger protein/PilZ domain-containing protein
MDLHTSTRDLEQYLEGHLPAEQSTVVRTHLEGCEQCQRRLTDVALDTQWKGPEHRGEPRVPVNFPARLKLLDPVTSVGPPHEVEVIEMSRGGLKIRTPRYLILKTLVQIRFNGKSALGEVRYCVKNDPGYDAGIKLVPDFPGSE